MAPWQYSIVIFRAMFPLSESLCQMSLSCSIFLTVVISADRYQVWRQGPDVLSRMPPCPQAVCAPILYHNRGLTCSRGWLVAAHVAPCLLLAALLNTPRLLDTLASLDTGLDMEAVTSNNYLTFYMYYQVWPSTR